VWQDDGRCADWLLLVAVSLSVNKRTWGPLVELGALLFRHVGRAAAAAALHRTDMAHLSPGGSLVTGMAGAALFVLEAPSQVGRLGMPDQLLTR
jgi:hypothetical protein